MQITQLFSTGEVARMIGVKPFTLEYHIHVGNIREPAARFLGKRCFTPDEVRTVAAYFGKEKPSDDEKQEGGQECSASST